MYIVNGAITIGAVQFYRIDNLNEERVGIDFLTKPFALVRELAVAEKICELLNIEDAHEGVADKMNTDANKT